MKSGERNLLAILFVFCAIAAYTAGYVVSPKVSACDRTLPTSEPDLFATLDPTLKTIALEEGMNITMGKEYGDATGDCWWMLRINGRIYEAERCVTT